MVALVGVGLREGERDRDRETGIAWVGEKDCSLPRDYNRVIPAVDTILYMYMSMYDSWDTFLLLDSNLIRKF